MPNSSDFEGEIDVSLADDVSVVSSTPSSASGVPGDSSVGEPSQVLDIHWPLPRVPRASLVDTGSSVAAALAAYH